MREQEHFPSVNFGFISDIFNFYGNNHIMNFETLHLNNVFEIILSYIPADQVFHKMSLISKTIYTHIISYDEYWKNIIEKTFGEISCINEKGNYRYVYTEFWNMFSQCVKINHCAIYPEMNFIPVWGFRLLNTANTNSGTKFIYDRVLIYIGKILKEYIQFDVDTTKHEETKKYIEHIELNSDQCKYPQIFYNIINHRNTYTTISLDHEENNLKNQFKVSFHGNSKISCDKNCLDYFFHICYDFSKLMYIDRVYQTSLTNEHILVVENQPKLLSITMINNGGIIHCETKDILVNGEPLNFKFNMHKLLKYTPFVTKSIGLDSLVEKYNITLSTGV